MKKCRLYLLGLSSPFKLVVDHQALVTILDKHTLDAIENPRLQRMKENFLCFRFTTIWKKGKSHNIPDAFSRTPVSDPTPEDIEDEAITNHHAATHIQTVSNGRCRITCNALVNHGCITLFKTKPKSVTKTCSFFQ